MLARMLINDSPLAQISRQFDRDLGHLFSRPGFGVARPTGVPAINAWQDEGSVHVEAELPGYRLEDIEILAQDDALTLRGTREIAPPEGGTLLRGERASGSFERTMSLPVQVDVERVAATLRDGVLHVTLPLTPEVRPRRVAVQA